VNVLKLMELQRHLMLMYTSCGWFFDELSGIETVQVIQYACRAVQLSQEMLGDNVEEGFLQRLEAAKSNIPEHRDAKNIYNKFARPAAVDLAKLAAHYAISSLFKPYDENAKIYCFSVDEADRQSLEAGRMKLAIGRARFTSEITHESGKFVFAALHFGDHNLHCGTQAFRDDESYQKLIEEVTVAFTKADVPATLRVIDKALGSTYSLKSMFRDDQRAILQQILNTSIDEAETAYRQIYEHHFPLAHFLRDLGVPLPKAIRTAAEFATNSNLRRAFANEEMDLEQVRKLLEEAKSTGINLDGTMLEYTLRLTIEHMFGKFGADPKGPALVERLEAVVDLARSLPFEVVLWAPQNVWSEVRRSAFEERNKRAQQGDKDSRSWVQHFMSLGEKLQVRVDEGANVVAQTG
jgi:hypothetical protein